VVRVELKYQQWMCCASLVADSDQKSHNRSPSKGGLPIKLTRFLDPWQWGTGCGGVQDRRSDRRKVQFVLMVDDLTVPEMQYAGARAGLTRTGCAEDEADRTGRIGRKKGCR